MYSLSHSFLYSHGRILYGPKHVGMTDACSPDNSLMTIASNTITLNDLCFMAVYQ